VVFAIGTVGARLYLRHRPQIAWPGIALLLYAFIPLPMLFTAALGTYDAQMIGWVPVGAALWIGLGLSRLPRIGAVGVSVALAAVMLSPIPLSTYNLPTVPLVQSFTSLAQSIQWGDVVVIDPNA
jgi:hypothetical protein